MNNNTITSKPHYEILDGLRGIAALMILIFHIFETFTIGTNKNLIIGHGYLAVDFFFGLSGFVIGYAYDDRWNKMSLSTFIKRRLIRLHPMVIIGMTIGAAMFYTATSPNMFPNIAQTTPAQMLAYTILGILMIPTPPSIDIRGWREMYTMDAPVWSLLFEYTANILYATIIRRFNKTTLITLVILAACATIYQTTLTQGDVIGGWEFTRKHLQIGFTRLLYPFFAGLLLYRTIKPTQIKNTFPWCSLILITILAIPRLGDKNHLWINGLYEATMIIIAFPAIIYLGANSKIKGQHTSKICKTLGELSFPLYIIHYPIIYTFTAWVSNNNRTISTSIWQAATVLLGSIAGAWIILKLYDEPVRNYLRKKFPDKPRKTPHPHNNKNQTHPNTPSKQTIKKHNQ
ncbi:MAG: acyltransferase [Tannerellaceae bacterium]|jgi:peptidoglycan/LPS O-acetylase OafA/YrhL|nr:acyltransferase [Tannerellaceae bacterium]